MNNDGLTIKDGPSITADGIDAGGKTGSNVGEAKNPTDAINKSTFDNTVANIGSGMNRSAIRSTSSFDNRVDRVGAGAAALAAFILWNTILIPVGKFRPVSATARCECRKLSAPSIVRTTTR